MLRKTTALIFTVIFCVGQMAYADSASKLYSKAQMAAKNGQVDFAYMHYRKLLREIPDSKFKDHALFASGEYFFMNSDFKHSYELFNQYLNQFSESDDKLFALGYMLKMAKENKDHSIIKDLEKQILLLKQQSFIFKEYKEYTFQSPLHRKHRAVYSIDNIEIYAEGHLLAKVTY